MLQMGGVLPGAYFEAIIWHFSTCSLSFPCPHSASPHMFFQERSRLWPSASVLGPAASVCEFGVLLTGLSISPGVPQLPGDLLC